MPWKVNKLCSIWIISRALSNLCFRLLHHVHRVNYEDVLPHHTKKIALLSVTQTVNGSEYGVKMKNFTRMFNMYIGLAVQSEKVNAVYSRRLVSFFRCHSLSWSSHRPWKLKWCQQHGCLTICASGLKRSQRGLKGWLRTLPNHWKDGHNTRWKWKVSLVSCGLVCHWQILSYLFSLSGFHFQPLDEIFADAKSLNLRNRNKWDVFALQASSRAARCARSRHPREVYARAARARSWRLIFACAGGANSKP